MTSHGDHDQQPGVSKAPDPETLAITAGRSGDDGALASPVWSSSTFESPSVAAAAADALSPVAQRFYSRNNNPSVAALESAVAELEGAEAARAFASGMGALFAVVFGLCSPGDHVVAQHQLYGGTAMLLGSVCPRFGIEVTFVDATEPGAFAAAVRPGQTMVVLAETPANPGLEIVDLDALGAITGPTTVVDSTFATPLGQRPLDHGVDLVVHSVTKGLAGHNDATLGMVAGPRDVIEWLWSFAVLHGANASPYDAVNALRGLRTLGVRLERQSATASRLAAVLEDHDGTTRVRHPSLASHPQYDLGRRQMRHPGGMVTFDVVPAAGASGDPGDPGAAAVAFIEALSLARIATSLGGPETLATHPVSTTHAHLDDDGRRRLGISPATVRLSVGLEHPDDVIADVLAALSLARA
jgi:cystathionine beta-lyase/cystathionine gamma-synthase